LLGLIVLPSEFYRKKSRTFFDQDISDIDDLKDLVNGIIFSPTKRKKNRFVEDKKTLGILIKKVRNGISHQQIECTEDSGSWKGVIIRDFNVGNNKNLELEVIWSTNQLREFAFYVADNYKREIVNLEPITKQKINTVSSIYF
jgi:hypothetical protein